MMDRIIPVTLNVTTNLAPQILEGPTLINYYNFKVLPYLALPVKLMADR